MARSLPLLPVVNSALKKFLTPLQQNDLYTLIYIILVQLENRLPSNPFTKDFESVDTNTAGQQTIVNNYVTFYGTYLPLLINVLPTPTSTQITDLITSLTARRGITLSASEAADITSAINNLIQ